MLNRATALFEKAKVLEPRQQFHTVFEALRLTYEHDKSAGTLSDEFARAWATLQITRGVLCAAENKLAVASKLLVEATECAREANQRAFGTADLLKKASSGETPKAVVDALKAANDEALAVSLKRSDALRDVSYAKAAANTEYMRQLALAMGCLDKCVRVVAARP